MGLVVSVAGVSPPGAALLTEVEATVAGGIADLEPDLGEARRPGPGRPRILPAVALWSGVLVCVLRGMPSQRAVWRLLTARGLFHYPRFALSDQAVYTRLATDGAAPLEALFAGVSRLPVARLAPHAGPTLAPFAAAVVALDETTLDQVAEVARGVSEALSVACVGPHSEGEFG